MRFYQTPKEHGQSLYHMVVVAFVMRTVIKIVHGAPIAVDEDNSYA
jgi:hypothetical protein